MTVSYWQDASANEAIECDVCVVGAGIVGLYLARLIAGQGQRVYVLEARHVAAGASGRNACSCWTPQSGTSTRHPLTPARKRCRMRAGVHPINLSFLILFSPPSMGSVLGQARPPETPIVPFVHLPYITKEGAGGPPQPGFFGGLMGRSLDLGLQTGTPVYVWKNNKIVDLTKEPRPSKRSKSKRPAR